MRFKDHRGTGGMYGLYRVHDLHMLVYAAMFAGLKEKAIEAGTVLRAGW